MEKVTLSIDMVDTDIQFNQKSAIIRGDPCQTHEVEVMLHFKHAYAEEHGRTFLSSRISVYNSFKFNRTNSDSELHELYGGLFKGSFLDKICLNDNSSVVIPVAPKSFEKCIVTRAGPQNISEQGTIFLELLNVNKVFNISVPSDIEDCRQKPKDSHQSETKTSSPKENAIQKLLLTISVPLCLAIVFVLLALLLRKKCSTKGARRGEEVVPRDEMPSDRCTFQFLWNCKISKPTTTSKSQPFR